MGLKGHVLAVNRISIKCSYQSMCTYIVVSEHTLKTTECSFAHKKNVPITYSSMC